jgi:uncharacterized protein YjiS (DUF1127 family)
MPTAIAAPTTDVASPVAIAEGIGRRIAAAVRAALARRKERYGYRQLLGCDEHLLRDMGVTRADIRQALDD